MHLKLRLASAATNASTFAELLSRWPQRNGNAVLLQRLAALISLCLLITYAAAQLVAGGKALQALLDWPLWSGAIFGAVLVAVYCFSGGGALRCGPARRSQSS